MAFVRAWAEGLPLPAAWERYMWADGAADARKGRIELRRLRDHLGNLARGQGRPEVAALLRRDPAEIRDLGPKRPSLEEFRLQHPADFYSEEELLALYTEEHGKPAATSTVRRRQRLRERLLQALAWLEQVAVAQPRPDDPTRAWLDDKTCARLAVAGIQTLAQLMFWIRTKGYCWHAGVPRIGREKARRIVQWLQAHDATLGALPLTAVTPRQRMDTALLLPTPRLGIVPLERLRTPSLLGGEHGSNRTAASRCKITAANDLEAVQAWLRLHPENSHTWRAYRKEAERFLLWSVMARGKPLSSLDSDDCVAYRDFLATPGFEWVGARGTPRWSEQWRPFEGPLSARSAATALVIVRSLCEWLVRRHYLDSNPWDGVPRRPHAPAMPTLRSLSAAQWSLVLQWLTRQPPSPVRSRLELLMRLAYSTGMRLSELAAACAGWLRHEQLDTGEWVWSLMVVGKRRKWREVPLTPAVVELLKCSFIARGLGGDLHALPAKAPLLARLGDAQPLSHARLHDIVRDAFLRCAQDLHATDALAADRIRQASMHWLRHTFGTHAIARGVPQDVVQITLGHESPTTTARYVHSEKARQHQAICEAFGDPLA